MEDESVDVNQFGDHQDLTPIDFFFCDHLKNLVYVDMLENLRFSRNDSNSGL